MNEQKIKALVVDDSKVAQMLLTHLLEGDPRISVVATVADGESAVAYVAENHPDVVVMDVHMPGIDGFEATRRIMEQHPVPIVICTGVEKPEALATTFRVIEAGALACVEKPGGPEHPRYEEMVANLRQVVRLMSEVKVVRRWRPVRLTALKVPEPAIVKLPEPGRIRFVGIGASTGGPPVLQTILASLPKEFPAPILIVQHIARGFLSGMADWLRQTTAFQVHLGAHGMLPLAGHVYLAPDDFHMGVNSHGRLALSGRQPENGLRPAVSHLFRSLTAAFAADTVGVLLTGMGRDGAAELKEMRDAGAVTIAQDKESSIVHGMPGEAIALGGAVHILPPEKIAAVLVTTLERRNAIADSTL